MDGYLHESIRPAFSFYLWDARNQHRQPHHILPEPILPILPNPGVMQHNSPGHEATDYFLLKPSMESYNHSVSQF
jgi:hypothetical protein